MTTVMPTSESPAPPADARLSRMLFQARENLEMWADVVESKTGLPAASVRRLVDEIDEYRSEHGWNPNGFGREQ